MVQFCLISFESDKIDKHENTLFWLVNNDYFSGK